VVIPTVTTDSTEITSSSLQTLSEEPKIISKESSTENISTNSKNLSSSKNIDNNSDRTDGNLIDESNSCSIVNSKDTKSKVLKEFVGNLNETLSEIDYDKSQNNYNKQGAKPKDTMKMNSKVTPHLSNRQRKELAKREKKKRREERRKEEEQSVNNVNSNNENSLENKPNSLVADLGAVSI